MFEQIFSIGLILHGAKIIDHPGLQPKADQPLADKPTPPYKGGDFILEMYIVK